MDLGRKGLQFSYTREEILLLRAEHSSHDTLPSHLFCPDYLTSHGRFSPDKYVECLWKNERTHKNVSRVIRSDIPEILQNGSTLSPQRRNFQGGCKEKESLGSVFSQSSARTLKSEKRGAGSWAGFNKGYTTNGYRSANESSRNNGTGYGRRDSERVEPMPEWMEDGPDTNAEIMQLGGFEDQEKRLEESFQKLGLPDAISRQKQAEDDHLVLPASDAEFAKQFGILDVLNVSDIESKIMNEPIEEPKSSRLLRFFGAENPQGSDTSKSSSPQNETVLPAVARLLSFGSKSIGPINESSGDFTKSSLNTSNTLTEQITSTKHQLYQTTVNESPFNHIESSQRQKKNIDLVPTAVMLQRSTVKDEVDVQAPRFSNPNSPSPISSYMNQEMGQHSPNQWQMEGIQNSNDSHVNPNYIPAFCRLGMHIFPLPNPIALAADRKHSMEAYANGDYKTMSFIQTRYTVQMQVFSAVQHFRNDPTFVVITANDPQFENVLKSFIEQQRQLESSLTGKIDDDLVECAQTSHATDRNTPLERLLSNPGLSRNESGGFKNLSILNKLPTTARPLTVEELERQIIGGNC